MGCGLPTLTRPVPEGIGKNQRSGPVPLEKQLRWWWFKAGDWEEVAPQGKFVAFAPENRRQGGTTRRSAFNEHRVHQASLKKRKKEA